MTTALAEQLCNELSNQSHLRGEIVLDDRLKLSIGRRLLQAQQQGYPYVIALGKKALQDPPLFEFVDVYSKHASHITKEELFQKLTNIDTIVI